MILPCRVTLRILPGVVDIPTGAWWMPDQAGVDRRGAVNVLTSEKLTPLAHGNAQHTIMVQIQKVQKISSKPLGAYMSQRYGFYLDTRSCTGCKACQIACKDKNSLPAGILWRRVVEIQGGEWLPRGAAWFTSIFAYFVSSACMHCQAPICAEVCPTKAIDQREDGIVLIDSQRCMGCRYCEMACPYRALQFDLDKGVMTKCDFCFDLLDEGKSPACVSACQMRVLRFW